jgi:hypothetical protein
MGGGEGGGGWKERNFQCYFRRQFAFRFFRIKMLERVKIFNTFMFPNSGEIKQ